LAFRYGMGRPRRTSADRPRILWRGENDVSEDSSGGCSGWCYQLNFCCLKMLLAHQAFQRVDIYLRARGSNAPRRLQWGTSLLGIFGPRGRTTEYHGFAGPGRQRLGLMQALYRLTRIVEVRKIQRFWIVDHKEYLRFDAEGRIHAGCRRARFQPFARRDVARRMHPMHFDRIAGFEAVTRPMLRRFQLGGCQLRGLVTGKATMIARAGNNRKPGSFVFRVLVKMDVAQVHAAGCGSQLDCREGPTSDRLNGSTMLVSGAAPWLGRLHQAFCVVKNRVPVQLFTSSDHGCRISLR
jgi:hypothetical protein